MSRLVIFPNALLLSNVVRYPDCSIQRGFVENGGWYFKRDGCTQQSWSEDKHVHSWPDRPIREVPVPATDGLNYNTVIETARRKLETA